MKVSLESTNLPRMFLFHCYNERDILLATHTMFSKTRDKISKIIHNLYKLYNKTTRASAGFYHATYFDLICSKSDFLQQRSESLTNSISLLENSYKLLENAKLNATPYYDAFTYILPSGNFVTLELSTVFCINLERLIKILTLCYTYHTDKDFTGILLYNLDSNKIISRYSISCNLIKYIKMLTDDSTVLLYIVEGQLFDILQRR